MGTFVLTMKTLIKWTQRFGWIPFRYYFYTRMRRDQYVSKNQHKTNWNWKKPKKSHKKYTTGKKKRVQNTSSKNNKQAIHGNQGITKQLTPGIKWK